jgi:hypothetical protein
MREKIIHINIRSGNDKIGTVYSKDALLALLELCYSKIHENNIVEINRVYKEHCVVTNWNLNTFTIHEISSFYFKEQKDLLV